MTEPLLCVLGFLFLVLLARVSRGRRRGRARWPGMGVRITRGPLNYGPYGSNPHGNAWSRPWT